jgi:hypothetical protein
MKSLRLLCPVALATFLSGWSIFTPTPAAAQKIKILIMPKLVGIPYYACLGH